MGTSKAKSQYVFSDLLDTDDLEFKNEIGELCLEEEDMLNMKNENDEDEPDTDENIAFASSTVETVHLEKMLRLQPKLHHLKFWSFWMTKTLPSSH